MQTKTFQPSWQDRLFSTLRHLPAPTVLADFLLALVFLLIWNLSGWIMGATPWGQLDGGLTTSVGWFFISLMLGHYLRASGRRGIDEFRPALKIEDAEYEAIRNRFLHLSTRVGWVATGAGLLISVALSNAAGTLQFSTLTAALTTLVNLAFNAAMFAVVASVFWYVIHQVLAIPRLYARVDSINILNLGPLTAFSGLTLRLALLFIFLGTVSYLQGAIGGSPEEQSIGLIFAAVDFLLAIIAFVVPLWGMHNRLAYEKAQMEAENSHKLTNAYHQLHRVVDTEQQEGAGNLRSTISALMDYRNLIASTSTWPWDTSTLRSFLSALLLPLALWFIQTLLAQVIAF